MFAKRAHAAHDFELNLTPIIDCFVTLICFLLLSATYVNLVGMDAKVPVAVPASSFKEDNKPKFKLELFVRPGSLEVVAANAGSMGGRKVIPNVAGKPDLGSLHALLLKVKAERPREFSIYFNADSEMSYEELVQFMDATRNLAPADGTFTTTDERNGKVVKVDTLFPDFIVAGLTEKL